MNTKQNRMKWIWVTLIVVLTSAMPIGFVFANHEAPLIGAEVSSRTYFEQYQAALEHMESNRDAAIANSRNNADTGSRVRFVHYSEALSQMERERDPTFEATPASAVSSRDTVEQYLTALEQMEQAHNAAFARLGESSRVRFEQYLEFAR